MSNADLEMGALAELATAADTARRAGFCPHSSFTGPIGAAQLGMIVPPGKSGICPDCGTAWADADEWLDTRDELLSEWS